MVVLVVGGAQPGDTCMLKEGVGAKDGALAPRTSRAPSTRPRPPFATLLTSAGTYTNHTANTVHRRARCIRTLITPRHTTPQQVTPPITHHLEQRVHLLRARVPCHLKHAVGDGGVGERHAHSQPVQLALHAVNHMVGLWGINGPGTLPNAGRQYSCRPGPMNVCYGLHIKIQARACRCDGVVLTSSSYMNTYWLLRTLSSTQPQPTQGPVCVHKQAARPTPRGTMTANAEQTLM